MAGEEGFACHKTLVNLGVDRPGELDLQLAAPHGDGAPARGGAHAREAPREEAPRHVYVHVPFCRAKCDYCDFASVPVGEKPDAALLDDFVAAVGAEWELERAAHSVRRLHTLYVGGGTPSLLGPARLERLLELFRPYLTSRAEVTVEANPEDVTAAFVGWAAAGKAAAGERGAAALAARLAGRAEL